MSPELIGGIGIALLLAMLAGGIPIGIGLMLAGIGGMAVMIAPEAVKRSTLERIGLMAQQADLRRVDTITVK